MAVLYHKRIIEHRHMRHAALGVAAVEIAAEQAVLFAGRLRRAKPPDEIAVGLRDPTHGGGGPEGVDAYPDRDAGHAGFAGRPVGDALAAAKAALRQQVVQLTRGRPHQMREDFPLLAPRQVGTRARRSEIELMGVRNKLGHRSGLTPPAYHAGRGMEQLARDTPPPGARPSEAGADGHCAKRQIVQALLARRE
jgi:hypothetical protein